MNARFERIIDNLIKLSIGYRTKKITLKSFNKLILKNSFVLSDEMYLTYLSIVLVLYTISLVSVNTRTRKQADWQKIGMFLDIDNHW